MTRRPQRSNRSNRRRVQLDERRGATVVEFALVAPLLFLFLFAALDIARANMIRTTAENAAYEGARGGVVPGATAADADAATDNILGILSIENATVTVTPATITDETQTITVRVDIPLGANLYAGSSFLSGVVISRSCTLSRESFLGQ